MNKTIKRILTAAAVMVAVNLLVNFILYLFTQRKSADGNRGFNTVTHTIFKRDKQT